MMPIALVAPCASFSASSYVTFSRSACGTTVFTNPTFSASDASISFPVAAVFKRFGCFHQPGQGPVAPGVCHQTDPHKCLNEFCLIGHDAHIARQCKTKSCARRHAIDHSDDRFFDRPHLFDDGIVSFFQNLLHRSFYNIKKDLNCLNSGTEQ